MTPETPPSEPNEHVDSAAAPTDSGSMSNDEDVNISLLDLLIVFAERKRLILWTTAVITVLAIMYALLLPKSYTATVTLLPPQQNSSMSTAMASQLGSMGGMAALAGGEIGANRQVCPTIIGGSVRCARSRLLSAPLP